MSSEAKSKNIILIDFDTKRYENIYLDLIYIQKKFSLSNFYLFNSTNGFNAICLDKLSKHRLTQVMNSLDYADKKYIELGLKRGYFVMRLGEDKKYSAKITNYPTLNRGYTMSNSHRELLTKLFCINIPSSQNFDKYHDVCIVAYQSDKYGTMTYDEVKDFKTIKEYNDEK